MYFSAGLKAPGAIEYTEPVLSAFEPFEQCSAPSDRDRVIARSTPGKGRLGNQGLAFEYETCLCVKRQASSPTRTSTKKVNLYVQISAVVNAYHCRPGLNIAKVMLVQNRCWTSYRRIRLLKVGQPVEMLVIRWLSRLS